MAAILWRKKLVLHRSLVEIFIGDSESPIMHAPVPEAPRDLLGPAGRRPLVYGRTCLAGEELS